MAFSRSVKDISQGYGSVSNYGKIEGAVLAAGAGQTLIIPATGATTPAGGVAFNTNGGPPPTRGRMRLRTSSVNAATTILLVGITVTDGTTTVTVVGPGVVTVAGTVIDWTYDFNVEINITSVTATVTTANNTSPWDFEVAMT